MSSQLPVEETHNTFLPIFQQVQKTALILFHKWTTKDLFGYFTPDLELAAVEAFMVLLEANMY